MRVMSLVGMMLITALAPVSPPATPTTAGVGTLDDGRLDPAWFGDGLEFCHADESDYLWVKPGFSIEGHKVRFVPFGEVQFLGAAAGKRTEKDRKAAQRKNSGMHEILAAKFGAAFGKRLSIVSEGEDLRVEGRIVDCGYIGFQVGMTGFKKYYGVTVDIKFTDAATGELLVGIHNRSISDDLSDWVEDMAEQVADDGFAKLYTKGERVKN